MDTNQAIVVYGTNDVYEAEVLRNMLNAAGIACELEGESQGGFTELVETRLLVHAVDADRALHLIKRQNSDKFEPPTDDLTQKGRQC
jgi:hypothetical protein